MSEGESREENKLKRITIKTEAGTRWFPSVEEFVSWTQQQIRLFAFMREKLQNSHGEHSLQQRLQQTWSQLQQFAQQQLKPIEADPENYAKKVDELTGQFQQKLEAKDLFTSEAPFAKFIAEREEEGDFQAAAVAIAYFLNENLGNFDLALATGLQKAFDWERGAYGKAESEELSLSQLRQSWDEELTRQTDQANQSQGRLDTLIGRADKQLDGQRQRFDKDVRDYEKELSDALEKGTADLESVTQTYDDKLALQAPVRYWGLQEKYHRGKVKLYAAVTALSAIIAIGSLMSFAWYVLDQQINELIVGRLVAMAVLTTFAIWAVKLCASLFMSHSHLHTDAQERRTMIHTYLALLRKKNALKEEERQLILQTLFRPNTTGMIREDTGPAHLVDLINRMAPKGQ